MSDIDRVMRIAKAIQSADGTMSPRGAAKAARAYIDVADTERVHEDLSYLTPGELNDRATSPNFNSTIALTIAVEKLTKELERSRPSQWTGGPK